ncbi:MAG TPA: PqqD family protein, partial [Bacteroidales bacterium]|nr:PqqD family protein [Bacteroidales bacterium]
ADMNSVYTLNESGAFIWELIDGKRDIEEMIEALVSRYDTDRETASEDLLSFIGKMSEYLVIDR